MDFSRLPLLVSLARAFRFKGKHVLTNKGKYGLKGVVHLAGLEPGAIAQVTDIAETNSISKKFLDHILTELRHAGFVYSKKGQGAATRLLVPRTKSGSERSSGFLMARSRPSPAPQSLLSGLAPIAMT
jgi:hypothetical protein